MLALVGRTSLVFRWLGVKTLMARGVLCLPSLGKEGIYTWEKQYAVLLNKTNCVCFVYGGHYASYQSKSPWFWSNHRPNTGQRLAPSGVFLSLLILSIIYFLLYTFFYFIDIYGCDGHNYQYLFNLLFFDALSEPNCLNSWCAFTLLLYKLMLFSALSWMR